MLVDAQRVLMNASGCPISDTALGGPSGENDLNTDDILVALLDRQFLRRRWPDTTMNTVRSATQVAGWFNGIRTGNALG